MATFLVNSLEQLIINIRIHVRKIVNVFDFTNEFHKKKLKLNLNIEFGSFIHNFHHQEAIMEALK